ncbi:MAG: HEAT repeat domain-containing protein [Moheibacter sp.]
MGFYNLTKEERTLLVSEIHKTLTQSIENFNLDKIIQYFEHDDTYIRKSSYNSIGKIYLKNPHFQLNIIEILRQLLKNRDYKVRQTVINAAGEIGKKEFEKVQDFFDKGLFDPHHSPRNAVIGSIKKMGEINPQPVLNWTKTYLNHPETEIRREICHGIELRGRKYPEDILPLLQTLEFDSKKRVSKTLIHVLGQISYKKDCLETVVKHLKNWKNKELVADALVEIIDVHKRYRSFSYYSAEEAQLYIESALKKEAVSQPRRFFIK